MMNVTKYLGYAVITTILMGLVVQTSDSIPDNAQVDVFPEQRYWLPHAPYVGEWFEEAMSDPERQREAVEMLSNLTPTTWVQLKGGGQYEGYELPPGWETYTDTYTTGDMSPLLLSVVFGRYVRWNKDGSWNY